MKRMAFYFLSFMILAACSADPDARLHDQLHRIQSQFTPLIEKADRAERRALRQRYHEELAKMADGIDPARLRNASRLTYAGILMELERFPESENILLPLVSLEETDLRIRALQSLMLVGARRGDAESLREHYAALDAAMGGDMKAAAALLLEVGNRMRDTDLETALELIDRGLAYPLPVEAEDSLYTAIHIRFVDGGLGNRERGVFLDRMAREYGERPRIKAQIEKKRGFLGFLGTVAPELDTPGTWLNRDNPLSLKELRGRYVLVDFFAPWCPDCRNSLDGFQRLGEKLGDRLQTLLVTRIYGFYADEDTPAVRGIGADDELARLKTYLEKKQVKMPVFVAHDEQAHTRFNASAIPHYVLIAPDGTVADLCMERVHGFFNRVEALVVGEQAGD